MRFLCLHGSGSNAEVLETQLSKLRDALGPQYDFVFLQGEVESGAGPGVAGIFPGPYYSFFEVPTVSGLKDIFDMIEEAWDLDGPFDGLLGFSQGGSIAASYLLQDSKSRKPFKCAIFFCCSMPFDIQSSPWKYMDHETFIDAYSGERIAHEELTSSIPEVMTFDRSKYPNLADLLLLRRYSVGSNDEHPQVDLPTGHIYASNDGYHDQAKNTTHLCRDWDQEVVVHRGGHSIPWDEETTGKLIGCIHRMNHAVELV